MILSAICISFAFGALVAAAVLLGQRQYSWQRCPECHWYHRGPGEFSLTAPQDDDGVIFTRQCPTCTALNQIELQKKFTPSRALTLDGNEQQKPTTQP